MSTTYSLLKRPRKLRIRRIRIARKKALTQKQPNTVANIPTQQQILKYNPMARMPEVKHYDVFNTTNLSQTGLITLLSNITTQGVGDNQRIGDSVFLTDMLISGCIIRNPGSAYDHCRMIILQDLQGYNTPIVSDVLENAYLGSGFAPFAPFNHYYSRRFRILRDTLINISTYNDVVSFRHRIKIGTKTSYIGGATFKNQIYILLISDEANVLQLPYMNYVSRIWFTDS